ncbi:MAG: sulfite exporter TauE/SafE family protein [Lewinellaceae bacterium]|nr:sulfite exporter TauE/SafE family protein [Lewinellaceae bacterium]
MEVIVGLTAFLASLLTLFSGFGLGTILTPVFGLFFPLNIAVALTGIVHLLNNVFKLSLLGKNASKKHLLSFGLPSVAGGLLGAWVLVRISEMPPLCTWQWGSHTFEVTVMKLCIAFLMILFALMEIVPALNRLEFGKGHLTAGGLLSGFFGGLSGHQGALRTAFLINTGLSKEAFIATGVTIACMVDLTRLPVYFTRFSSQDIAGQWRILLIATLCAFAGAYLGARFVRKITFAAVRWIAAGMIVAIAILLITGII